MKKRITFTLDENILEQLKKVSEQTMIPQSRMIEKAIQQIIKEYTEKSPS